MVTRVSQFCGLVYNPCFSLSLSSLSFVRNILLTTVASLSSMGGPHNSSQSNSCDISFSTPSCAFVEIFDLPPSGVFIKSSTCSVKSSLALIFACLGFLVDEVSCSERSEEVPDSEPDAEDKEDLRLRFALIAFVIILSRDENPCCKWSASAVNWFVNTSSNKAHKECASPDQLWLFFTNSIPVTIGSNPSLRGRRSKTGEAKGKDRLLCLALYLTYRPLLFQPINKH